MKKLICAILTLSMIFAFAVCGSPAAFAGKIKGKTEAASAATPAPTGKAAEALGEKTGNHYVNSYFGMQADFPKNWQILGDEEAMKLIGIGLDAIGSDVSDAFSELLENNAQVFDLYAMAQDNSGDNVNVLLQSLNALQNAILTEETLLSINEAQMADALGGIGMEDIQVSRATCTFAGKEHGCLDISLSVQGVKMYERMVILLGDGYYAAITASSLDETHLGEILGFFKA